MENNQNNLLTQRQLKILKLWATTNFSKAEIGDEILYSLHTVDMEIRIIYRILSVNSRHCVGHQAWILGIFKHEDFIQE